MRKNCKTSDNKDRHGTSSFSLLSSSKTSLSNATSDNLRHRTIPSTTETMNNADNFASVEVKKKAAKEEARYELIERGEKRDFEKPDKPVDGSGDRNRVADNFTSLPP